MNAPNKLTIEQVENWLRNGRKLVEPYTVMEEAMMQLADTMRENERLREAIIVNTAEEAIGGGYNMVKWAYDALFPNKPTLVVDPSIPTGEVHVRDRDGKLLGKITDAY